MPSTLRNRCVADKALTHTYAAQEELLKDCMQMIPDTKRRLADAVSDLLVYMVSNWAGRKLSR